MLMGRLFRVYRAERIRTKYQKPFINDEVSIPPLIVGVIFL